MDQRRRDPLGLDETTREHMGAGRYANNSWRFGLDRLLLGISQATEEAVVEGVVPYSDIEGLDAEAVGKLWQFLETLKTWYDTALEELSAKEWHARIQGVFESLFLPNMRDQAEKDAKKAIEEALSVLLDASGPAGDRSAPMPWLVVRAAIQGVLHACSARQPFLSGGVTFCGMVPLRAVPFRVVCLLGMDDGAFPRQEGESGLNLIQSSRWIGERALPEDDRLLFLQCIMAAKDVFYVSYTCMDVQAGTILEPSPVVFELLDFMEQSLLGEGERGVQEGVNEAGPLQSPIVHCHPMQPFSLRYLNPRAKSGRVFTFSKRWAKASLALAKERQDGQPRPIGYDPVPLKQDPLKEGVLELANLKSFFKNPTEFFFEECLGVSLPEEEEELPDDEPFELGGLERWSLRERLFSYAKKTGEAIPKEPSDWVRGTGKLAPPPMDLFQYGKELEGARKMLEVWNEWRNEASPRSVFVQAELEPGLRVVGVVGDVWFQEAQPVGIRKVLNGDVSLHLVLPAWIDYLAWVLHGGKYELCLAGIAENKGDWSLVGPKRCTLDRATAKDALQSLVKLYLEGHQKPLPFMPRLAGSFWQKQSKQPKKEKPFDWLSKECNLANGHASFEAKDPFFRLHLPVTQDMAEEFERIARAVCGPIAACLNDPSSSS
jgi:exodeoxyribonuclease V gamma subunit